MIYRSFFVVLLACTAFLPASMKPEAGGLFLEGSADPYNIRGGVDYSIYNGENFAFSYDLLYVRIIKDKKTWRMNSPWLLYTVGFGTAFADTTSSPDILFNPGFGKYALWFSIPWIFTNPRISYRLTDWWWFSVGYNTDFFFLTPFYPHRQIYFAPRVRSEWIPFARYPFKISFSGVYQVVNCFDTHRGLHLEISFCVFARGHIFQRKK